MIASLPDLPVPTGWPPAAGTPSSGAAAGEGTGLDFAGLLGAAFAPSAVPSGMTVPLAESGAAVAAQPAPVASPSAATAFAQTPLTAVPLALPTGKIVPEEGAPLPPAALPAVPAVQPAAAADPAPPRSDVPLADLVTVAEAVVADTAQHQPMPAAVTLDPAVAPPAAADAHSEPAPPPEDEEDAAPAAAPADGPSPDPALLAALVPPTVTPPPPAPAPARLQRAGIMAPADRAHAPLPARVTLPPAAGTAPPAHTEEAPAGAAQEPPGSPASMPAPAPAATDTAPQTAPATLLAPAPAAPAPDRIEAPRTPVPQQETAIAQVGDLREALRSARPEMTLRHAEFGFVSLRLEQPAPEQWRAVLASRDPGFVPAIQAALAERAVAAASASADTGQFMGQNGSGDQRYGASPNGGQGSLSPYMGQSGGQSGGRDGEAAPDHRRPSTAAALAARGQDGEVDGSGSETRGLFA